MFGQRFSLPQPPRPQPTAGAFVLCPFAGLPAWNAAQEALYRWAFEQAQAVVQPSLPERDLAGTWN